MAKIDIKKLALWVMCQYEITEIREMYASLHEKDSDDFKTWRDSFFFWLIAQTANDQSVRSEITSAIRKLRVEQKELLEGAAKHERELTKGLPEYEDHDLG